MNDNDANALCLLNDVKDEVVNLLENWPKNYDKATWDKANEFKEVVDKRISELESL